MPPAAGLQDDGDADGVSLLRFGKQVGETLIDRLLAALPEVAREVAADLGPAADADAVAVIVRRHLDAVADGRRLSAADLARLRADGAAAARAGVPLADPLDTYLSTGWVAWEHAVRLARPDEAGASWPPWARRCCGPGTTSRPRWPTATQARSGRSQPVLARRGGPCLMSCLHHPPGAAAQARLLRRAALVGLDPALPYGLVVARAVTEIEEEGAAAEEVARRLARDPGAASAPGQRP